MTVVVPYVIGRLAPGTVEAVRASGLPYELVNLDPGDSGGYARLLDRLWRCGLTFVVVEHDMAPTPAQLREIRDCPHPWCTVRYRKGAVHIHDELGVAKFSAQLTTRHPSLATNALYRSGPRGGWCDWRSCAALIGRQIAGQGVRSHRHDPPVVHLGDHDPQHAA